LAISIDGWAYGSHGGDAVGWYQLWTQSKRSLRDTLRRLALLLERDSLAEVVNDWVSNLGISREGGFDYLRDDDDDEQDEDKMDVVVAHE
jgi:hypothetical protein